MGRCLIQNAGFLIVLGLIGACADRGLAQGQGRPVQEPPLNLDRPAAQAKAPARKPAKPAAAAGTRSAAAKQAEVPLPLDNRPAKPAAPSRADDPFDTLPAPVSGTDETPLFEEGDGPAAQPIDSRGFEPAAPVDPEVHRVQAPAGQPSPRGSIDENPIPLAKEPPTGSSRPSIGTSSSDPFVLPPERIPTGPSQVGVALEVRAPEVANLNVENLFYVRVKNTAPTDALGVTLRYPLPDNLEFVDAEPAPSRNDGRIYYWQLNSMPSGSERKIKVRVKPIAKGTFDHAVTVSVMAGGRARTMVRQPELKVEIRADKTKPLKGTAVLYELAVTNIGDHPARDVEVQAKLTPGLSHPKGSDLALKLRQEFNVAAIEPGQSVPLKLEVDTTGMGVQTVEVSASSPDVPAPVSASAEVEVVAPELKVAVDGPSERYPENVANYRLTVTNVGTAPAKSVTVAAQVPIQGKPVDTIPKGRWVAEVRTFYWSIPELPPGATETFNIQVRMGGIGLFALKTGAQAEGVKPVIRTQSTDIKGVSKLSMTVSEPRGVLDEGEESVYEIRIFNEGSKEAEQLQVKGVVSENLQVLSVSDAGRTGASMQSPDPQTALFQVVDRLPAGSDVTLSFKVRAVRSGNGTCDVTLMHQDIPVPIRQTMVTKVTPSNGTATR